MDTYRRLLGQRVHFQRISNIAWITIGISLVASYGNAQKFEFEGKKSKQTIDFIQVKNLIIVPLYINDKGPYNFLLDTGVGQMIITDTTFIKTFEVKQYKTVKIQGYGLGKEIEAILTRDLNVKIGRAKMNNLPTAVFKEDVFDLSAYLGIKIYGILGYYFFNSFVVKVNYDSDRITFYRPDPKLKKKGTLIPMHIANGKPYINAHVKLPARPLINAKLLVDNGSSHPLMLEALNNDAFPAPAVTIPANLGVGINGEIKGVMGRISSLSIHNYTFNQILAGFPAYSDKRNEVEGNARNGTLGADVLKHFLVTFDYQNEAIYLKKSRSFKKEFEHDMSGMELFTKDNKFYVGRIEPGSPADEAKLHIDDEILSFNFKKTQSYSLNELSEMLREHDGKNVIVEVQRKDVHFVVVLTLRRRI
jgi:hypothetical protein